MLAERKVKLGVAGLGRAFTLMLPTLSADPRIQLVAAADPRAEARARFEGDFGARSYETVEALCNDPDVEAVYIATPHQDHAEHVEIAVERGKHVLVEKPMAISLGECTAMIKLARARRVQLVIGHSHSFDGPILHARRIIESGAVGAPRMIHALNYTDYMVRPRRPEELDTAQGGGVMFSQAAHQIDIVRLLGGGMVKSVRAATGAWEKERPTEGAYSAFLSFEDGAFASVAYSGYAHFDSDEFNGWIGEMGAPKDRGRYGAARKALQDSVLNEAALKAARNYGGAEYKPAPAAQGRAHQHFGLILVSCERADLRPLPTGVAVYEDFASRLESVPVPKIPRAEVIDEFHAAIVHGEPPLHGGEWSRATLEVCLAMLQSAKTGKEVKLKHQVAAPSQQRGRA